MNQSNSSLTLHVHSYSLDVPGTKRLKKSLFASVNHNLLLICLFWLVSIITASLLSAQSFDNQHDWINGNALLQGPFVLSSSSVSPVDSVTSDELSDRAHQAMQVQVATHRNRSSELSVDVGSSAACPTSVFLSLNTGFERRKEHTSLLFSISGAFMSVSRDSTKGSTTALGAGALYRLYLSAKPGTLYLAGRATLLLCMESDESKTQEQTALSIGPRFSQSVGYRFNNSLNLEIGVYEQWLAKTLLLDSDFGFTAGIAVQL